MLLDDDTERETLFARFAAYRDSSTGYGWDLDTFGKYSADYSMELDPGRSCFVHLNSAPICSKKDVPGSLRGGTFMER